MKKISLVIAFSLLLSTVLCACDVNTYSIEKIGDVLESSLPFEEQETEVKLTAEIPDEAFLAATDYYYLCDDPSGEWQKVLFKTDYIVTDVKFFSVSAPQTAVSDAKLTKEEIIFTVSSLTPDKPLVVDVKSEGAIACRAICFTDPDGKVQYYSVVLNANGSVLIQKEEMNDYSGFTAEYAEKDFLENTDSYVSYEDKKEDYDKIVYKTVGKVTELKFLSIEPVDTDKDYGRFRITKVLYTLDELTPELALVAETAFADVYPKRGISFVDEFGVTRYFTVEDAASASAKIHLTEVPPMVEE